MLIDAEYCHTFKKPVTQGVFLLKMLEFIVLQLVIYFSLLLLDQFFKNGFGVK